MLHSAHPSPFRVRKGIFLAGLAAWPAFALAQSPAASSYATRDGRVESYVLACASVDGTFTAQPCGVAGFPVHVLVDGGSASSGGSTPTTAAGTPSGQVVGIQGAGAGALPVPVAQAGSWAVAVSNLPALSGDGGALAHLTNPGVPNTVLPAQQLTLSAVGGAVTYAPAGGQSTLSVYLSGLTASGATMRFEAVSDDGTGWAVLSAVPPTGAQPVQAITTDGNYSVALAGHRTVRIVVIGAGTGTVTVSGTASTGVRLVGLLAPPPNRSAAWSDSSLVAGATSALLVATAASRTGLHIVNNGTALACINWTGPATISGGACGLGSWPIPPGGGYTEDQPGNVSPEQINVVAAASTILTVKVR